MDFLFWECWSIRLAYLIAPEIVRGAKWVSRKAVKVYNHQTQPENLEVTLTTCGHILLITYNFLAHTPIPSALLWDFQATWALLQEPKLILFTIRILLAQICLTRALWLLNAISTTSALLVVVYGFFEIVSYVFAWKSDFDWVILLIRTIGNRVLWTMEHKVDAWVAKFVGSQVWKAGRCVLDKDKLLRPIESFFGMLPTRTRLALGIVTPLTETILLLTAWLDPHPPGMVVQHLTLARLSITTWAGVLGLMYFAVLEVLAHRGNTGGSYSSIATSLTTCLLPMIPAIALLWPYKHVLYLLVGLLPCFTLVLLWTHWLLAGELSQRDKEEKEEVLGCLHCTYVAYWNTAVARSGPVHSFMKARISALIEDPSLIVRMVGRLLQIVTIPGFVRLSGIKFDRYKVLQILLEALVTCVIVRSLKILDPVRTTYREREALESNTIQGSGESDAAQGSNESNTAHGSDASNTVQESDESNTTQTPNEAIDPAKANFLRRIGLASGSEGANFAWDLVTYSRGKITMLERTLRTTVVDAAEARQRLVSELRDMAIQRDNCQMEKTRMADNLREITDMYRERESRCKNAWQHMTWLRSAMRERNDTVMRLQMELEDREKVIEDQKTAIGERNDTISMQHDEIEALTEVIEGQNAAMEHLEEKYDDFESNCKKAFEIRISEKESELCKQAREHKAELDKISGNRAREARDCDMIIDTLQRTIEQNNKKQTKATEDLRKLIEDRQSKLNDAEHQICTEREKREKVHTHLRESMKANACLARTASELQEENSRLKERLETEKGWNVVDDDEEEETEDPGEEEEETEDSDEDQEDEKDWGLIRHEETEDLDKEMCQGTDCERTDCFCKREGAEEASE